MPLITDLFGQASIPTDVAIATTVKNDRVIGGSVLEGYDFSKYPTDTPVFVVTYKKTTDPVTAITSITQFRSWKALVNPGANTLTNLTIQPGYNDDIGNKAGDFVECIPTSAWANSLIQGIRKSINDDGTLKTSAVQAALNISSAVPPDWTALATTPSVTANNGQHEHKLTFTGVDYRDRLQLGTKLRIPRTIAPPTQSAQFVQSSSQFLQKATPTGITFTDTFTCEADIFINAPTGQDLSIISRYDNTNGFVFYMNGSGQLIIGGYGSSASKTGQSVQQVPFGRWVHVAGTVQMSTGAIALYIDGMAVSTVTAGTATSFTQSGNLQIARHGTGNNYFNGQVSNARIWSAVRTLAQIRDNANIQLVGNETNLVAYYKLNGDFVDSTTNVNTLTPSGGAVATFLDNPFNAIEFGFITGIALVSGNTEVILYSGLGRIPNATLGGASYSGLKAPYGFPLKKEYWSIVYVFPGSSTNLVSPTAANTWTPINNLLLQVPTGLWKHESNAYVMAYNTGSASTFLVQAQLDTASPIFNNRSQDTWRAPANANYHSSIARLLTEIANAIMTTYRVYIAFPGGVNGNAYLENGWTHYFTFESKYL